MYKCPQCGAEMKFDPDRQKLVCGFCGREEEAGAEAGGEKQAAPKMRPTYSAHVFTCPDCGAELLSTDETVATFCSYCGGSVLFASRIEEEDCPDYVIPFKVTKEECEKAYRRTLKKALFAPSSMKQDTQIERFRGIYMPYWIYSFEQDDRYRVKGRQSRRRGDYVYTKHYRLESHLTASCRGLSYDASATFADNLSGAIAPFDIHEGKEFEPAYLSGFYADKGNVESYVYSDQALQTAGQYVASQAVRNSVYRKYNVDESDMADAFCPRKTEEKLGMFPVWFLGCRSHDGSRISYAVVNGQTGRVAADLPIDLKKYLLGSLILAVPIFFLLNLFLTLTPTKALIFAIVLALFCLFVSNRQCNRIYTRENQLDDEGLQSTAKEGRRWRRKTKTTESGSGFGSSLLRMLLIFAVMTLSMSAMAMLLSTGLFGSAGGSMILAFVWFIVVAKLIMGTTKKKPARRRAKQEIYAAPMQEKWKNLYKPAAAIVIALAILILRPVSDLYYYIGAAVSLACVIWSFFDIIKEHNQLTTRKLPQLEKRGGDENA